MNRYLLILLCAVFLGAGCTNPVDDISIDINGKFINYKATIILTDPTGANIPSTLSVKITGADSSEIYDYAGLKNISVLNGIITLGVHPSDEPTSSDPVDFNVVISGANYGTKVIPVRIVEGQFQQLMNVSVINTARPPTTVSLVTRSTVLKTGLMPAADELFTNLTAMVPTRSTVTLASGTGFKAAGGTTLTAGPMVETLVHYNTTSTDFVSLFPGATYSSELIKGKSGTVTAGFMYPAAYTTVTMTAGGQDVAETTQPFAVSIEVNPAYKMQANQQTIGVGTTLQVYSYDDHTDHWTYRTEAPVVMDKYGKLAVNFTSTIPEDYFVGDVSTSVACTNPMLKFSATWLGEGTLPVNIEIWSPDAVTKYSNNALQLHDGSTSTISGLPATAVAFKVISTSTNEVLASGSIANPCSGEQVNITLAQPAVATDLVTLSLAVNCPGKGNITPPSFDMFYRVSGSNTSYKLLGTVDGGKLTTTALKIGSNYDFRANFGTDTKTVNNRQITQADAGGTGQALSISACGIN